MERPSEARVAQRAMRGGAPRARGRWPPGRSWVGRRHPKRCTFRVERVARTRPCHAARRMMQPMAAAVEQRKMRVAKARDARRGTREAAAAQVEGSGRVDGGSWHARLASTARPLAPPLDPHLGAVPFPRFFVCSLASLFVPFARRPLTASRHVSNSALCSTIVDEFTGELLPSATAEVKLSETPASGLELPEHDKKSGAANNYFRPEGQNVGNFISGRSSSRVLAPPGGRTHVQLG